VYSLSKQTVASRCLGCYINYIFCSWDSCSESTYLFGIVVLLCSVVIAVLSHCGKNNILIFLNYLAKLVWISTNLIKSIIWCPVFQTFDKLFEAENQFQYAVFNIWSYIYFCSFHWNVSYTQWYISENTD